MGCYSLAIIIPLLLLARYASSQKYHGYAIGCPRRSVPFDLFSQCRRRFTDRFVSPNPFQSLTVTQSRQAQQFARDWWVTRQYCSNQKCSSHTCKAKNNFFMRKTRQEIGLWQAVVDKAFDEIRRGEMKVEGTGRMEFFRAMERMEAFCVKVAPAYCLEATRALYKKKYSWQLQC